MVEFLLVAALHTEFVPKIRKVFQADRMPKTPEHSRSYFKAVVSTKLGGRYDVRLLCVGRRGGNRTAAALMSAIKTFQPRYVIMFGIAAIAPGGGRKRGHILAADQIVDIEESKRTPKGEYPRPDLYPCDDELINHLRMYCPRPSLHVGTIISQPNLVRDAKYRNSLIQHVFKFTNQAVIGLEMEGGGLASAIRELPQGQRPGLLLIKGGVDWANYHKSDKLHSSVALRVARFVRNFLFTEPVAPADRKPEKAVSQGEEVAGDCSWRGNLPTYPSVFVGRQGDLIELKRRLGVTSSIKGPIRLAIRGWPGVGKTSTMRYLIYEKDIAGTYPDGMLWVSLGQNPDLLAELGACGRHLGLFDIGSSHSPEEASTRLRSRVADKRMLIIIDDVWHVQHAVAFLVGGSSSGTVFTTREPRIAEALSEDNVYPLKPLSPDESLELLSDLAPNVVKKYPDECRVLVVALEGLPLALNVAGRMLRADAARGWSVKKVISDLISGDALLAAEAPYDRGELLELTTPSVAALLKRSTDRLSERVRGYFSLLGVMTPKPAHFSVRALREIWQESDPRPVVDLLVDRGLLEPVGKERFEIHALLALHAKSLLMEKNSCTRSKRPIVERH